ncbi:hypothetical protein ACI2LO_34485 [Streptomyces sp. NPDC033754]
METINLNVLTPEQISRAADYIELVWQEQAQQRSGPDWRSSTLTATSSRS